MYFRECISIHAPLAGSDVYCPGRAPGRKGISIHAPLAGSDRHNPMEQSFHGISIHAPLAGSDGILCRHAVEALFQSTLPSRGATAVHHTPQA